MKISNYIKYTAMVCALTGTAEVLAQIEYQIRLVNTTDGEIMAEVELAGGQWICPSPRAFGTPIPPNGEATLNVGACCSNLVRVRGTSGSIKGQVKEMTPPVTGFGIACHGYTMIIKKTIDNTLVLVEG
ncbi:MAG TPA: hypothetical protein VGW78_03730 [Candidatus Babeliales bacterium]|jgi:hypothetical protein|nr:hypothetical protein [Candidatus Babeliales bacterium]